MEHPIQYLTPVLNFLSHCIWEYGDYLFIAFGYGCFAFLAWFLTRPRRDRGQDVRIMIIPFWTGSRRRSDHDYDLF